MLPTVGHGYSVEKNWMPQYEAAYARMTAAPGLCRGPARRTGRRPAADPRYGPLPGQASPYFAVFLSGDGGWVGLDRGVSGELAQHGIAVVGWDSLKYFLGGTHAARVPRGSGPRAAPLTPPWGKAHALLIGYSQGADTMPFMVNRLPAPSPYANGGSDRAARH